MCKVRFWLWLLGSQGDRAQGDVNPPHERTGYCPLHEMIQVSVLYMKGQVSVLFMKEQISVLYMKEQVRLYQRRIKSKLSWQ